MDGVSAALAVVSLGMQIAGIIQTSSKFLRSVRNAPQEILRLADLLDQLQTALSHVDVIVEQQSSFGTSPGPLSAITKALQNCKTILVKLERLIDKLRGLPDGEHKFRRVWASMQTVLKKEELQEIRNQIQESLIALQLALSIYSTQLQ